MKQIGILKRYEVLGNEIKLYYGTQTASVFVIAPDIIRFFMPLLRPVTESKAVEVCTVQPGNFTVQFIDEAIPEKGIKIQTELLTIEVIEDFIVNIYNAAGKLICADYRGEAKGLKEEQRIISLLKRKAMN